MIRAVNETGLRIDLMGAYVYATVSTNSFDEIAQGLASELDVTESQRHPLLARLADWVSSLGVEALAEVSDEVAEHRGPLTFLAARAAHQMTESEEGLYAELSNTGSTAWQRLHSDVTSQLTEDVELPGGVERLPMAAIRGLATNPDQRVRRAAYEAEMRAWPTVAVPCAAAMNAVKGEANTVNRRRGWEARSTHRCSPTTSAGPRSTRCKRRSMQRFPISVGGCEPRRRFTDIQEALPWYDLNAPLPFAASAISWNDGLGIVRGAFASYSPPLGSLVDRAIDEEWIDAGPRAGKRGGAFCMPFVDDRSLVFLNWSSSVDSAQTTAHELGHAYHNTQLAHRTTLQRRMPMALAETASIFCETLVVEEGLQHLQGRDRLALLDVNLLGAVQVIVDIRSRFLFETEVFARRQRRTIGVSELNDMMLSAQADAYGDGLDQSMAHPYMWAVKPHYYGAALLQLAVHVRVPVRSRPVRQVPRGSAALPTVVRRRSVAGRHEHRRGARCGVRLRRVAGAVLDGESRRAARPHRAVHGAGQGRGADEVRWLRCTSRAVPIWRCYWTANRAIGSIRSGKACTSSSRRPPR